MGQRVKSIAELAVSKPRDGYYVYTTAVAQDDVREHESS